MNWNALLAPLRNRVMNMVTRAVLNLVDDATKMQALQVTGVEDDTLDDVERFQNYGFTSVPLEGAEAVVVRLGGRGDHPVVLAVDDRRYRLRNLESGEVAVYTDQGDSIVIRRGGTVEVTAATKVKLTAPVVELAGNSQAGVRGTDLVGALKTLATALKVYTAAIAAIADPSAAATPVLSTAVDDFKTAADAALSSKVKLS